MRRGDYVEVMRGRHAVVARVIWSHRERLGLIAQDRICLAALVGQATPPHAGEMPNASASPARRVQPRGHGQIVAKTVQVGALVLGGGVIAWLALSLIHLAFAGPLRLIEVALST